MGRQYLGLVEHHLVVVGVEVPCVLIWPQQLQIVVAALVDGVLARQALDYAWIRRVFRMQVQHWVLIQKTVLNHMRVFDAKHSILEQDIILPEVLTWRYFQALIVVVLVLLIIILVVILTCLCIQPSVFLKILWWPRLDFNLAFVGLIHFVAFLDAPHRYKSITFNYW